MQRDLKIELIPIDRVRPNPYQPRKVFSNTALEELANSILEHGLIQPITVRKIGELYELIAGERRLKASKIAGLTSISAVLVETTTKDSAVLALIENLQRENLNFLEESKAYYNIMQDYGYTQKELATTLGKNQSTVANKLRILRLSLEVQNALVKNGLTERHARAILKLPEEKFQLAAIEKIVRKDLNVKKTEQLVDQMMVEIAKDNMIKHKSKQKVKTYIKDIRLVTNTITQAVDLIQKSGIDAKYTMKEQSDGYEIKIKIPTL